MISTWAVMSGDVIANVVVATAEYAAIQGWVGPISTDPGGPGIGWSTPDGGTTWVAPSEKTS